MTRNGLYASGAAVAVVGLAIAASKSSDPAGPEMAPGSAAAIANSGEVCAPYAFIASTRKHLGGVVLTVPECNGQPEAVEVVGTEGRLVTEVNTGSRITISCASIHGLGVSKITLLGLNETKGSQANVLTFDARGKEPVVIPGPVARAQIGKDKVFRGRVPSC